MKALFAGSFDPFTIGHLDITKRALKIFDELIIGIGHNDNKKSFWDADQRLNIIKEIFNAEPRIDVKVFTGLTVKFARQEGAQVLVRGIRSNIDFEFEKNLADINKELSGIETVLLIAEPKYEFVSSSMIRELITNGYNPSKYLCGNWPLNI